jgi:hypothetical protein
LLPQKGIDSPFRRLLELFLGEDQTAAFDPINKSSFQIGPGHDQSPHLRAENEVATKPDFFAPGRGK